MNDHPDAAGSVVAVHYAPQRDAPAVPVEAASVRADFGIENDWRSRPGRRRQLTLIEAEALEHVVRTLGLAAVPPGASRRQVVVRGIRLDEAIGKHLQVGPVLLAVHDTCDPCANMERTIGPGARHALEGRGGVVASVAVGGVIRPGDGVAIVCGSS